MQEVVQVPGDRFCYDVLSRTRCEPWRVDLEAYGGNGACACENFTMRYQSALENGASPSHQLRCFHIKRAILWAWDDLFPALQKAALGKTDRMSVLAGLLNDASLSQTMEMLQAIEHRIDQLL